MRNLIAILLFVSHSVCLANDFEPLLKEFSGTAHQFSIYIAKDGQQVVWQKDKDKALVPASITKLVTGLAVLDKFGPEERIKTVLKSEAKITDKQVLKGNLYLVGGGDPSFVSENMWILVNHFTRNQISEIEGDILVDDSLFDAVRFDASRLKNRVSRAYDAPVGAMSFNWNSVNVYIRDHHGQPKVFLDPANEYTVLDNQVKLTKKSTQIEVQRVELAGKNKIIVKGVFNPQDQEVVKYVSISDPALWSGYQLKSFLLQRGIQIKGQVKLGRAPQQAKILGQSESKPLALMIADMNKFSNNYVAEMLTKLLATSSGEVGSVENGVKQIDKYLKGHGLLAAQMRIDNPSGLTRSNTISAYAMWQLLFNSMINLKVNGDILASLPLAGADGTLKNRFKNNAVKYSVRAKTGYINEVVSLAGYYAGVNGPVPFVMIYNGPGEEAKVRLIFDKILTNLVTLQ